MEQVTFEGLPFEIVTLILEYLPTADAIRATRTCKQFHQAVYRYRRFSTSEFKELYPCMIANAYSISTITDVLFRNPSLAPSANRNFVLLEAVSQGHVDLVDYLLESKNLGVDPAVDGNLPIQVACKWDQLEIVKLLLKDPRVDPSARYNLATRIAYSRFFSDNSTNRTQNELHFNIVKELFLDARTNLILDAPLFELELLNEGNRGEALLERCCWDDSNLDLLRTLLSKGMCPNQEHNAILQCGEDYPEVVKLLLDTDKVIIDDDFLQIMAESTSAKVKAMLQAYKDKMQPPAENAQGESYSGNDSSYD
jgi:ankyrin repeat protein